MSRGARPQLSVIMPVFNEEATVRQAVDALLGTDLDLELILVDDGSTDGTGAALAEATLPADRVSLLRHPENRGKGAAVRTGLEHAQGEFTAIFDADLEYDPADLSQLLEPLASGEAGAVFGVRAFDGYTSHSFLYVMGNRGVTLVANVLFNVYLRDVMTCHKAMRTELFRALQLRESGFTIEPEITAALLRRGERIYEVPVRYRARSTEQGKKLTARDGLRVVVTLVRYRALGR